MGWFFSWYLTVTLLGWLTFPLIYRLFPALADRGYSLSRAAGLLVWGYAFWLLTSLGLSQNDAGGLLLGLLILAGLSLWGLRSIERRQSGESSLFGNLSILTSWIKYNRRLVLSVEGLFLVAFAFLAFARASNPELTSAEKPMELMFINAILRSPTFPPRDAWLSGYAISYYYFGYVMTAMLAKLTGVPGSAAHNLMTALIFALGAIGSYGILYNLLALRWKSESEDREPGESKIANSESRIPISVSRFSFIAPLFLLIVSNVEGLLEILHRRGLFWSESAPNFWTWLDIKDLSQAPPQPLGWVPERYLWWWRASRVISDYDLSGGFKEIIDEFPFFSFLHADLHPHVLAIPFSLMAISAALNLFLGGWRWHRDSKLFKFGGDVNWMGLTFLSLLLGGLAFLNTWDILIAAVLIIGAYVLSRVREAGWPSAPQGGQPARPGPPWSGETGIWERAEDLFILGIPLVVLSFLLYLPFYIGFSSQLGGVIPNLVYPTRGVHLWVMLGTLLLPLYAYLIYLWRAEKLRGKWWLALILSLGLVVILWAVSWLLGLTIRLVDPSLGNMFLQMQGISDPETLFAQAGQKRLAHIGSLLTMLTVLVPAGAFLLAGGVSSSKGTLPQTADDAVTTTVYRPPSTVFALLLITLGTLLLIGPEFLYLRDQFGTRINTVFKFYYQAWMLWSLAAAYGIVVLLQKLRSGWDIAFRAGLFVLLLIGLIYPVLGILTRTDNFQIERALTLLDTIQSSEDEGAKMIARQELNSLWTLDYFNMFQRQNPDEAAAIRWLESAPDGVVAEAIGGSYSGYARVSTLTGQPTVLGWPGHESQWRGGYEEQASRQGDIETLYATADWNAAREIIARYNIHYVFVGNLERGKPLREEKFQRNMRLAFQQGNVVIYEVP